jgi:hypothetical protein
VAIRRAEAELAIEREGAIAATLRARRRVDLQQGGLFDAREERAAAIAAEYDAEIRLQLDHSLAALAEWAIVEIGSPRLLLVAGGRP